MGACVGKRRNMFLESFEAATDNEIAYLEKASPSVTLLRSRTDSSFSSPSISRMVQYLLPDKVLQSNSATGFFTSVSGYSTSTTLRNLGVTEITSQLYLGSLDDALNENELRAKRVTHIISLVGGMHQLDGIKQKHYKMNDYGLTDVKKVMAKVWQHVEESQQDGNKLFVHCLSGQNRSATLALAILMKHYRLTLYAAFKKVKNKRPIVQINERYGKQLISIEKELFGKSTLPENWMQIDAVDMQTGKVTFVGENVSPASSVASILRGGSTNQYFRASGHKLHNGSSLEILNAAIGSKRTNGNGMCKITSTQL